MDINLGGIYRATVKKVNADSLAIDVPDLGLEELVVEHVFTLGYESSETGFRNILPKVNDEVMVFFEAAEHHRPIVLLGAKFEVKSLKEDEAEIATETDKIKLHAEGINIGSDDSDQPLVLGFKLLEYLSKMYNHQAALGNALGIPPMLFQLSAPTKALVSDRHKTEKGS